VEYSYLSYLHIPGPEACILSVASCVFIMERVDLKVIIKRQKFGGQSGLDVGEET